MMGLYYELEECAWRLTRSSKGENAKVRKRVEKICRELRGLREYALNIAKPVDFIDFSSVKCIGDYLRKIKQKILCAGCHKDITYTGGWEFPQEPKKYYCLDCQSAKFQASLGEKPHGGIEQ